MNKKFNEFISYLLVIILYFSFVFARIKGNDFPDVQDVLSKGVISVPPSGLPDNVHNRIYDSLKLNALGLSKQAFDYAITGFNYLKSKGKLKKDNIISIVDFSLNSGKKRLFILDIKNRKILFNTYVAHGKNSGKDFANHFSNQNMSFKSSLGFYITQDTYNGCHGYSLRLHGEETGINDNAVNRAIVMHSAWYVNENIIKSLGYSGRSEGCPAIPEKFNKPIIEKIKNGSCLFLYSPDKYYISHSEILQKAQAA